MQQNNLTKTSLSKAQIDIVMMEAFPHLYAIKQSCGEEVMIEIIQLFGGSVMDIPSESMIQEVFKTYFNQLQRQTQFEKLTYKNIQKSIKSDRILYSPKELYERIKPLNRMASVNLKPFFETEIEGCLDE